MTCAKDGNAAPACALGRAERALFLGRLACYVYVFGLLLLLLAYGVSGKPSGGPLALICGALTAVIAAASNLVFHALLGVSALFVEDTSSLYWAAQKLSFAFGGPTFPPDHYQQAMGAEPGFIRHTTLALAAWTSLSVMCVHFTVAARSLRSKTTAVD